MKEEAINYLKELKSKKFESFIQIVKKAIDSGETDYVELIKNEVISREEYIKNIVLSNNNDSIKAILDYLKKEKELDYDNEVNINLFKGIRVLKRELLETTFFEVIKEASKENILDCEQLIKAEIISQVEYDRYIVPKETHKNEIKQMIVNKEFPSVKFRYFIENQILTGDDLEFLTEDTFNLLLNGELPPLPFVDEEGKPINLNIELIPEHIKDRNDVFIFGASGAGKTCFFAGLFYYAYKKGAYRYSLYNPVGRNYATLIIRAIEQERLLERNASLDFQYMAVDFMIENRNNFDIYPMTFYEFAGEYFFSLYNQDEEKMHPKLKEHLFDSNNRKIIFLVIPYDTQQETIITFERLIKILQQLEKNKRFGTIGAIAILVTKWDKSPDRSPTALTNFINKNFSSLYTNLVVLKKKHGFHLNVFSFSLGDFTSDLKYSYREDDSKKIFEWLCNVSLRIDNNNNRSSIFSKLF